MDMHHYLCYTCLWKGTKGTKMKNLIKLLIFGLILVLGSSPVFADEWVRSYERSAPRPEIITYYPFRTQQTYRSIAEESDTISEELDELKKARKKGSFKNADTDTMNKRRAMATMPQGQPGDNTPGNPGGNGPGGGGNPGGNPNPGGNNPGDNPGGGNSQGTPFQGLASLPTGNDHQLLEAVTSIPELPMLAAGLVSPLSGSLEAGSLVDDMTADSDFNIASQIKTDLGLNSSNYIESITLQAGNTTKQPVDLNPQGSQSSDSAGSSAITRTVAAASSAKTSGTRSTATRSIAATAATSKVTTTTTATRDTTTSTRDTTDSTRGVGFGATRDKTPALVLGDQRVK